MDRDPFKEYLREGEPDKVSRGYAWSTAIGLQAVDGLKTSEYLIDTAIRNIEGKITLEEAKNLIDTYYEEKPEDPENERMEEADKVSARIAEILSEAAFSFSPNEYISIHRRLFQGIYRHAGKIRDYNITMNDIIHHLAVFISRLWQIHIFEEGNTRTTAVFFIKYLKTLGFSATNDIFAENAWYFRNALVRANYTNLQKGIHETTEYLEVFLRNLLLNEKNELHNRYLHISGLWKSRKVDIGKQKVDIQSSKVDIENILSDKAADFSGKTVDPIYRMFEKFGYDVIFGRSAVVEFLGLQNSSVSKLLSKLAKAEIIESVSGHGKGKYRFTRK